MSPKPIVPPEDEIASTHTDLTLEREKIVLERERLSLERERLAAERDRWRSEAEFKPGSQGRLVVGPATLVLAALLCCVVGALIGVVIRGTDTPPASGGSVAFELQKQTQTNEQGEVSSVFFLQTVEREKGSPARLILQ